MKKKSHRKPHQTGRKKSTKSKSLFQKLADQLSKPLVLGMSVVFALVLVIYATYAWNTAADEKNNHFEGGRLSAVINETFVPNLQWQPGTKTDKIIQVTNTGDTAAFVRLSLDEYLLSFDVDTIGDQATGNLTIISDEEAESKTVITMAGFADWSTYKTGEAAYPVPYEEDKQFYVFKEAWEQKNFAFPKGSTERNEKPLRYLSIQFTERTKDEPTDIEENDWFYSDGYFYYAAVLYPGETSMPLTKDVLVKSSLPNSLKGALYVLDVNLGAIDIMKGSLEAGWQLSPDDDVHKVLDQYIRE